MQPSAHDQQLKLSHRIGGAQLMHIAGHQPDLLITRGAVALGERRVYRTR
jgi:hypothetical protein